jgi:polyhydroxybutyrate depolymerase
VGEGISRAIRWTVFPCVFLGSGAALPAGATTANGGHRAPATRSAGCRSSSASSAGVASQERSLVTSTTSGTYLLSTPRHQRNPRAAPLVLIFYGFASSPAQFSSLTDLPRLGTRAGDIVAVPHIQPGETEWQFNGHGTDAAFVSALVASLERTQCIDTAAVYATGFSAGAAFTIAYACAHQAQIKAIATVAVEFQLGCRTPMSILAFHGTADPEVRYQNGTIGGSLPGVKVRGTELNMGDWARLDGCRAQPTTTQPGSQVVRQVWPSCGHHTRVRLYTVVGGGHTWPGADPAKGFGLTTQQVSATATILAFFASL